MEGVQIQSSANKKEKLREVGLAVQPTSKAAKPQNMAKKSYQHQSRQCITFAMGRLADQILEACNVALYAAATAAVRANEDASHIKQDQGEKLIKKIANKIKKINKLRRALESTVDKIKKNMKPARYVVKLIKRQYMTFNANCVEAKIKSLQALKTGYIDYIKKIREEAKFRYINEMMLKDESKAYSLITGKRTTTNNQNNTQQQEIHTTTRAFEFWSQLWNPPSTEATNYDELEWIQRVKDSNQFKSIKETKFEIEGADISNYIKNKKNWSAPGPDGICNYWIKRIKRYHEDLAEAFNAYLHLDIMKFPKWFCEGITYRIHKGGDKEDEAYYRPITCINNTCKILTGIVAKHLHQHTKVNNQLMEEVQRGGMTDKVPFRKRVHRAHCILMPRDETTMYSTKTQHGSESDTQRDAEVPQNTLQARRSLPVRHH
ncbi:hypothetical protein PPL_12056 [Heterostelium album PN500]|uniref:Uncharacterized protein n=1 Tax=Heterostelium pallidum (strain ATCC 26659 / Pp 5 / PN500) TaxID=670386 RepID=D3BLK3_HETP5|nr:hypothetical protein PPL_12056 [Heterostelium album PN500]EFA77454.1 hypothetical protein PPL_12056 [Heterostelium album PN500]|eukprot:XP_020429582.1 hypothetical protein PPL_12056 [Heterostelium album PN500]